MSLMVRTAKIEGSILRRMIERKIEDVFVEDQFGFGNGKGNRDETWMSSIISERTLDIEEELCVCSINWQKAFDNVNWTKLLQIRKETGIDRYEKIFIIMTSCSRPRVAVAQSHPVPSRPLPSRPLPSPPPKHKKP
jgi:hypothetical protein